MLVTWIEVGHPTSTPYFYLTSMTVAWNMLKSPAISLLENARAERLLEHGLLVFGSVFESHGFRFTERAGFPDHIEIASVGPLRNILLAPLPLPLTKDTFFNLFTRKDLHDALKNWEEATRIKVLQLMRDSLRNPTIKPQNLHLATTIFFCNACHKFLSYPEVCVHPCAFDPDELNRFRTLCMLVDSGKGATSWNVNQQITFRKQDQQAAIDILQVIDCTMDYSVVTVDEMDEKDILLQCLTCRWKYSRIEKSQYIFSWLDAVRVPSR